MSIRNPRCAIEQSIDRALRRMPSSELLELADSLRSAALMTAIGQPDDSMTAIGSAAELLGRYLIVDA